MNHPNEDQMLNFALDTLDIEEKDFIENHIKYCLECKTQLDKIKKELDAIQNFDPQIEEAYFLPQKSNKTNFLIKIAAVLVLGFLSGYLTSDYFQPVQTNVTAQTIIPRSPSIDSTEFIMCPIIDLQ